MCSSVCNIVYYFVQASRLPYSYKLHYAVSGKKPHDCSLGAFTYIRLTSIKYIELSAEELAWSKSESRLGIRKVGVRLESHISADPKSGRNYQKIIFSPEKHFKCINSTGVRSNVAGGAIYIYPLPHISERLQTNKNVCMKF